MLLHLHLWFTRRPSHLAVIEQSISIFVVKIRISSLIRPLILISADDLLSCLSLLISVAASHFPWICDVTRLLCRSE